jgi:hypothetical protein
MAGYAVDYHSGDKIELAKLLEKAAPMAEDMNLWLNGEPADKQFTQLAVYLRRVHAEENV